MEGLNWETCIFLKFIKDELEKIHFIPCPHPPREHKENCLFQTCYGEEGNKKISLEIKYPQISF